MPKLIRMDLGIPALPTMKKVAAYARVSVESETMRHSLSAQISYYSSLIQKNPDWQYAGVFADYGISGTRINKRNEFQRMIEAADKGEIDIILTKSIQRFARNTVDLLVTVRHLKDIGVEVRFDREHLSSLSSDGELMLTILASFAQEESRSISNNCKWSIRKRFQKGIPNGRFRVYGYRWEGDELVIVPEEAEVVRWIYMNFLLGKSRLETERELAAEGITTRSGNRWVDSNIRQILTNVTYTGNLLLQKAFIADPITKRRKKNRGELPQYYVENTHPAIIDKATFDHVQEEMARRRELGALANKSLNTSCFTGKIKCPYCGKNYYHRTRRDKGFREIWVCGSAGMKNHKCPVGGGINQEKLKQACAMILGLDIFDETVFRENTDFISVPARNVLEFHLNDGRIVTTKLPRTSPKECWTPEYRAMMCEKRRQKSYCKGATVLTNKLRCAHCGCNFRRCTSTSTGGKAHHWRCADHNGCSVKGFREDRLKAFIAETLGLSEFDDTVFDAQIDHIDVISETNMVFCFKDGRMISRAWERPKRVNMPWTEERRRKVSERMTQLRKERKVWRREK